MKSLHNSSSLYFALLLLVVTFSNSCTNTKRLSSECKDYVSFIKGVWQYNDSTSTYNFRGNPEFWFETNYIIESCLKGKSKKEIIKIFGTPSKEFKFINYHHFYYCIDEECLLTCKTSGKQIGFFFDLEGKVVKVFVNPPLQQRTKD